MLQKRLLTVLVAVSIPLSSMITSAMGSFHCAAAWAADVDYNAGADASGYQSPETKNSDLERSDASASGSGTTDSGSAGGNGTNPSPGSSTGGGTAGDDGSVDSMWSETPGSESKTSKTKKKTREKTKSTPKKKNSDKIKGGADPAAGADAGAGASGDEAASPAATNPTNSPASEPASNTPRNTNTTTSDVNAPSDFGSYPAVNSGSGRSVLDQPVSTTIFGTSKPTKTESVNSPAPVTKTTTQATTPSPTQDAPQTTTSQPVAPQTATTTQTATQTLATPTTSNSQSSGAISASASLCPTRNFFQSELVRTVSWPGVGPFKGDSDPNDLADPQDNKLTLKTEGDKLSSAELFLMHQPGNPQGFINLQMVMDFMLEALGTKDKRINEFNSFLEKNREKVVKKLATEEKPLVTNSGPYQISIASSGANNESSYLVQIHSRAADGSVAGGSSGSDTTEPVGTVAMTPRQTNTNFNTNSTTNTNSNPNTSTTVATGSVTKTAQPTKRTPPNTVTGTTTKTGTGTSASPNTTAPTKTSAPKTEDGGAPTASGNDGLKQEFVETIRGWQAIKKVAVRNCDPSELSKILTGKALDKQTVAIGWLVKKKDYYELTPKGVVVDRYEEISQAPKRYAVFAQVKEFSRLMDQTNNKMLSESDDSYKVKYTIERTGDHWSIYDSDLIKTTANAVPAADSKAPNKPKH